MLSASQFPDNTSFVKLLFEAFQRFLDGFVFFYVYNYHTVHPLSDGKFNQYFEKEKFIRRRFLIFTISGF